MKHFILLSFVLFLFKNSFSQNLIQNGSFESYTNPIDCNSGGGFYDISQIPAVIIVNQWQVYQSPDYFNMTCNNNSERSAPLNFFGYCHPRTGTAYGGIIGYAGTGIDTKEYLYQQLTSPLISGKIYQLNFYVSLADASNGAIKNIGAYFCSGLPSLTPSSYINVVPQIVNQNGFLTDTLNWVQIQGLYQAVGGEQYVIFGNFNSNANTDTVKVNTSSANTTSYPRYSYYYIDDITLIDQSTVGFNELTNGASIEVYPNPANDVINFKFSDANTKRKIELYNKIGELVLSEDAPTQNSLLNIHHLQSGVYFVKVSYANGMSVVKKVVKQ
jgi:OOP family OmpA-OmpF porin